MHSQISLVLGVIGGLLLCGSVGTVGAADESSEVGYYKDACHKGDVTACFELGYLYERSTNSDVSRMSGRRPVRTEKGFHAGPETR